MPNLMRTLVMRNVWRIPLFLLLVLIILGASASWIIYQCTPGAKNLTQEEKAIEQAKQFFMQTHMEPIDYVDTECLNGSIPSYKLAIFYLKWENDSYGDFLFDYRIDYFVEPGKVEPGPIAVDTCYSWVLRYVGAQPIVSQEQANQTFFMLIKRSPFSNWAIYLGQRALSLNITEAFDCYKESVMFQYAGVNCLDAKLILSYDIYKTGVAVFQGQKEIIP